jgi:hypothetical protein
VLSDVAGHETLVAQWPLPRFRKIKIMNLAKLFLLFHAQLRPHEDRKASLTSEMEAWSPFGFFIGLTRSMMLDRNRNDQQPTHFTVMHRALLGAGEIWSFG